MIRKIILLLLIPSIIFAYSQKDILIDTKNNGFNIKIILNSNIDYSVTVYDYGANIILNSFSFDKIWLKKINSKYFLKIIPLEKDKTLLKIQSTEIFNEKLFKVKIDKNTLNISYNFNKLIPLQPENIAPKVKTKIDETDKEDKIIEDITKKVFQKKVASQTKNFTKIQSNKENISNFSVNKSEFISRVIKTYSVLGIMCIFLIGISFFFRKIKNKNLIKPNNNFFKIIYKEPIAPKKDIAIIKIYDEYLLIGITEYNINLLAKIESENLKQEIKLLEGDKEKKKFIKYIKEENEKLEKKDKSIDKDLLISSIERKIKKYRDLIS